MTLGTYRDIPASDVGTNAQVMAWIMGKYGRKHGYTPAIVTGKPVNLGGSLGREEAAGRGVSIITGEVCKALKIQLNEARLAIQGFGSVVSWIARLMAEPGAKVVAVSDVRGGIFAEPGLDIPSTCEHASETGSVVGMKGAPDIDNAELLMLDVELLIQAALGGAITGANADKVSAQLVVEAANSPVTPEAGEILRGRGITVIPANGGGVTVSYFERVQNLQQFRWDQKRVNRELERKMVDAWRRVNDRSAAERTTLRIADYVEALSKVAEARRQRLWQEG